jgi:hypothetical protein
MKTLRLASFLILLVIGVLISCSKNETAENPPPTAELATVCQVSVTDEQINEGILTAMDAADSTEDGYADIRPLGCAIVTTNIDTKTVTVDFGTGCVNPMTGDVRSGKIIIVYAGDSYATATERTFEFQDFRSIDSITLNGTFTQNNIVRTGNTVGFTLTSSDFTFLLNSGKLHTLVSYEGNFSVDLGKNIRDLSGHTTTVSGSSKGINKDGLPYSINTITPFVFSGQCAVSRIFYPISGACDVKIGNAPKFNISWGNGACDKIITVSFPGNTIDVVLQ